MYHPAFEQELARQRVAERIAAAEGHRMARPTRSAVRRRPSLRITLGPLLRARPA